MEKFPLSIGEWELQGVAFGNVALYRHIDRERFRIVISDATQAGTFFTVVECGYDNYHKVFANLRCTNLLKAFNLCTSSDRPLAVNLEK